MAIWGARIFLGTITVCLLFYEILQSMQLTQSSALERSSVELGALDRLDVDPSQQCIDAYMAGVQELIPTYTLHRYPLLQQSFAPMKPLVLGAGFNGTGTRSLAVFGRQLGLRVHEPLGCEDLELGDLGDLDLPDLLLPVAELFLDLYAPGSKVILTLRNSELWASRGLETLPVLSLCGRNFGDLSTKDVAKLFDLHHDLVRCIVPPDQLLEMNIDLPLNTTQIAQFLGVFTEFEVPFPQVGNRVPTVRSARISSAKSGLPSWLVSPNLYRLGDRLAICITGQIRRLHLQSKLQLIIEPALAAGHNVEVYMVMDPRFNSTSFVHHEAGTIIRGKYSTYSYSITGGPFYSLKETVGRFPSNITVVFDPFIPKDYPVDPRYVAMMNQKLQKAGKTPLEYSRERAKSHMRQWEALDRCWQLILATNPEELPSMAMRLRDDVAVVEQFVPFVELMPRGIYTPSCESYNGLNDKGCIISGVREVQKYFTKPLAMMRNNFLEVMEFQKNRTINPFNPENVLYDTLALSDVPNFQWNYFPINPISILQATKKEEVLMCHVQDRHNLKCFDEELWKRIGANAVSMIDGQERYVCVPAFDPSRRRRHRRRRLEMTKTIEFRTWGKGY